MNYIKQIFTFIVLVSLMISCKKDDDEVKTNPFVTARTRGLNFNQQPLPLKKRKQFIYAAAKKPGAHHSAMAAIINKTAGVINVESTI